MNKSILKIFIFLILSGLAVAYYGYSVIYKNNVKTDSETEIFIKTGSSYNDVLQILKEKDLLKNIGTFNTVASVMKYQKDKVPGGRYVIKPATGNRSLITKLRSGDQDAIQVTINNVRIIPELAGVLSRYFETDSMGFLQYLSSPSTLEKLNKTKETLMTAFLPDTYEMFWTDSPEKIINRLNDHRNQFFKKNNSQLQKIGLTAEEAYTLASIVDKESNFAEEHPIIAGVYLNRLKIGERLAADPTVVFALQDFSIRRVLNSHLAFDSPYNTYMYAGLPPGPICMPNMSSLKGVLNPQKHDYIFFCAKPGYNSGHNFAVTYSQHLENARIYQNWLNAEGIK
jgi:UPF0755 protein